MFLQAGHTRVSPKRARSSGAGRGETPDHHGKVKRFVEYEEIHAKPSSDAYSGLTELWVT